MKSFAKSAPGFEYEARYLQGGMEVLEPFLLADDVYWPLGLKALSGEPAYPQLTLGGMLLAHTRAAALAYSLSQQTRMRQISEDLDHMRARWKTAWLKKVNHELHARQLQWANFLEDYRERPRANYDRYDYEVFRRVIIELLWKEIDPHTQADVDHLEGLDLILRSRFSSGPFIWSSELQAAFPFEQYWFLYGYLRED